MFRKFLIVFSVLIAFSIINAAEVTEVASSFDYENPFDFNLDIQYLSTHHFGSIKREYNTMASYVYEDANGNPYYTTESRRVESKEYEGNPALYYMHKMLIDMEFGLYHDLSLSFALPIVFSEQYKMLLWDTSNLPGISSLPGQRLFPWSGNLDYENKGVGDIQFGLQWAPFNDKRKNNYLSWLVGIDFTFPTSSIKTPKSRNRITQSGSTVYVEPDGSTGKVGGGLFRFDFRTAVSKRYSIAEPYFQFILSLPVSGSKSIYKDPKEAVILNLGTDIYAYENKKYGQRIRFRTDLEIMYTNKGNAYNVITDARSAANRAWVDDPSNLAGNYDFPSDDLMLSDRDLLPVEDPWVQVSGMFKISAKVYKYIELGGFIKAGYRHKYYLTNADASDAGYISGLDAEGTPWIANSGDKNRLGGRLTAEQYIVLDWGFNLKAYF